MSSSPHCQAGGKHPLISTTSMGPLTRVSQSLQQRYNTHSITKTAFGNFCCVLFFVVTLKGGFCTVSIVGGGVEGGVDLYRVSFWLFVLPLGCCSCVLFRKYLMGQVRVRACKFTFLTRVHLGVREMEREEYWMLIKFLFRWLLYSHDITGLAFFQNHFHYSLIIILRQLPQQKITKTRDIKKC